MVSRPRTESISSRSLANLELGGGTSGIRSASKPSGYTGSGRSSSIPFASARRRAYSVQVSSGRFVGSITQAPPFQRFYGIINRELAKRHVEAQEEAFIILIRVLAVDSERKAHQVAKSVRSDL